MERPTDESLDVDAPNESAPGHELPDPSDVPPPAREREAEADPGAPNESAPGHHPEAGSGA